MSNDINSASFEHRFNPNTDGRCISDTLNAISLQACYTKSILELIRSQFEDVDDDQRLDEDTLLNALYAVIAGIDDIQSIISLGLNSNPSAIAERERSIIELSLCSSVPFGRSSPASTEGRAAKES